MNWEEHLNRTVPKVIGVGMNYIKHIIEMGGKDIPDEPVIFFKPWSSIAYAPKQLKLSHPNREHLIHHEIELGVLINKKGYQIKKSEANDYIGGYFLLLDVSDRSMGSCKKPGLPWDLSKGQDNFFPVSDLISVKDVKDPYQLELELQINGKVVQKDLTGNMHFKIDDIIEYTSQYVTINDGDVIMMGTPQGVGPMRPGDKVEGWLRQGEQVLATLKFDVI